MPKYLSKKLLLIIRPAKFVICFDISERNQSFRFWAAKYLYFLLWFWFCFGKVVVSLTSRFSFRQEWVPSFYFGWHF